MSDIEIDTLGTWTTYHILSDGPKVLVYASTNDDNDDGMPDGEIAEWRNEFDTVEQALAHTGKCRRGFYGQPVMVYLDSREVR